MNHGLDTDKTIYFYEQEFYPLSNFSAFTLIWRGYRLDTAEAAYHWEKFPPARLRRMTGRESPQQEAIRLAPSAHEAFKLGQQRAGRRDDWDTIKVDVMRQILRAKITQHTYVLRKLLESGDRQLIENSWKDDFWGWGPNRDGQNMLGKLWMEIRTSLHVDTRESLLPSLLPAAAQLDTRQPSIVLTGTPVHPNAPPTKMMTLRNSHPAAPPAETMTRQGVRDLGGTSRPRRACSRSSTGQHHALGHTCVWCEEVLR